MAIFEYELHNKEIEALLRKLATKIAVGMPPEYGFTLLIFGYNNHELFYISSAEREGVVSTMKEFIAKYEKEHPTQ
jgi:hypothetical protein